MLENPKFVTIEHVDAIVSVIQKRYPKEPVRIVNRGALLAALNRPSNHLFYSEDGSKEVYDIAACTMEAVGKAHALVQGNKRLALMCGMTFMALNGYRASRHMDFWARVDAYCFAKYETYAFDVLMTHGWYRADILRIWFYLFLVPTDQWRKEYSQEPREALRRWYKSLILDFNLKVFELLEKLRKLEGVNSKR